ncbi:hypothetical protein [Candidatus Symbiopectobacterium sp. PLON1]|uniref:hypothetical protein n=1 Tax=Candidatus Symbiopectobacterium sp. PLON1 TaxID=2794575 RepID=UPI001A2D82EB|nr:hypothetical protein [Candidatus Symbiopectobacterium sp. PLON1]MBG6248029.1 hypothetical protein [Candidatus Symbiopectobacterium sp. PLON1]
MAEIGVTLTLVRLNPADYLSDIRRLHQTPLMAMFALNCPFVAALPVLFGDNNPYNYGGVVSLHYGRASSPPARYARTVVAATAVATIAKASHA